MCGGEPGGDGRREGGGWGQRACGPLNWLLAVTVLCVGLAWSELHLESSPDLDFFMYYDLNSVNLNLMCEVLILS